MGVVTIIRCVASHLKNNHPLNWLTDRRRCSQMLSHLKISKYYEKLNVVQMCKTLMISVLAASAHQQHHLISSISASAASVHQRISSISASGASSHHRISSIRASAGHGISSISTSAASFTCIVRDICTFTSILGIAAYIH